MKGKTIATPEEMKGASKLLTALAAKPEYPVYLNLSNLSDGMIRLEPALAATLRELLAHVAVGRWPLVIPED